jgi:transcription antitermination factor NusG
MTQKTNWFIVYIGDQRKIKVVNNTLRGLNKPFTAWTPMQKSSLQNGILNGPEQQPIFPGYMFIHLEGSEGEVDEYLKEAQAGFLLKTTGGNVPATLSEDELNSIKEIENKNAIDVNTIQILNINVGDKVEIINGPFIGALGSVLEIKKNKVVVEINIFGRCVSAEIDVKSCNPCHGS